MTSPEHRAELEGTSLERIPAGSVPPAVSVVIPACNEAAGVGGTIQEVADVLDKLRASSSLLWEVIVVDDGSADGTAEAAAAAGVPECRVLRHEDNRGYGAALKTGIRAAEHSWILIVDADGTYPARHIPAILACSATANMIVGARTGASTHIPWLRRPAKWFLTRLASYLSGFRILDLNSGLRLFPKELADRFARLLPDGFSFTSTITLAALSAGWTVKYRPIDYRRREGRSKIRPLRDTIGFLSLIIRTVLFFDPLKVLLPLAVFFVAASGIVAVTSLLVTGRLMDVTTVLLFVTGVQILVLAMIAESINRRLP